MGREVILIAGASSDIGLALIEHLLAAGDALIVAHYHAGLERIERLRVAGAADRVQPVSADFASVDAVDQMIGQIIAEHGAPTQVVYLPALRLRYERFARFDLDHFDRDLTIQVRSAVVLLRKALPLMAKMPRAKVVFLLSSVTRGVPPKYMAMYATIKQAQLGLMRALASEYAATGVTVNAVSPGMVETRFLDDLPQVAKQMAAAAMPRQRNAVPGDVIGAIEFLLSEASDFITGIEIPVSGGSTF